METKSLNYLKNDPRHLFSNSFEIIENIALNDCVYIKSIISGSLLSQAVFKNVRFIQCTFISSRLENSEFVQCNFNRCKFHFCHLNYLLFSKSQFISCDTWASPIRKTTFLDCELDDDFKETLKIFGNNKVVSEKLSLLYLKDYLEADAA
jgi:uncharacterized protein YjbI with pentapeptide repeats